MEVWQQIMDFTDENAAKVSRNQWNTKYLEVVGTNCEVPEKLDDICKRIPKLKIETRTRYVKPQGKSKLGIDFRYVPPRRTRLSAKPNKNTVVSVKVVMPKANDDSLTRNCICTCQLHSHEQWTEVNDDNEEITLEKLLEIIQHYDQGVKINAAAISNVVRGYQANITLDQDYVKRILMALDSSDLVVQEMMLLLIHRLSRRSLNVKLLLEHGVLDDLLYLMLMGSTDDLQTQAALCIGKLTEREEFADLWMETMVISGTEALFDVLEAEEGTGDELRNIVLETVTNIASNQKMASMLIGFGLEIVIELTRCKNEEGKPYGSPTTQRLATKALTAVLSHSSTMVEQFLAKYQDAIEGIVDILQYCACPEQKEAARFLATLTLSKTSIESIISHHAIQHILWAMTCSHCRFVREYTSKAFKNITNNPDEDKLLQVLSKLSTSQVSLSDTMPHIVESRTSAASLSEVLSSSSIETNTNKIIKAVKTQSSCTPLEKVMVEIFAILTLCFQTDSLHLNGQSRTFRSDGKSGGTKSTWNENYLTSLRVLSNTLVAIETLIRVKDKDDNNEADSLPETSANLNLATLFIQCGGLQFIDQLEFLSTKLQSVNSPSLHSIDPTTLPPRDLVSLIKNTRTELISQGTRRKDTTKGYPDFGFHPTELQFVQQTLSLLTLLSQATAPDFDPAQEDLKLFQYRKRVVGKKRHISFRTSAIVVKTMLKLEKSTKASEVAEKPAIPVRKKSSSRKVSCRSARSTSSMDNISSTSRVSKSPLPVVELGTSSKAEMLHYLKQSLLNSHLISHLAAWVTCDVYDIQVNVIKVLRYLMHICHIPKQCTDTQSTISEPQEAWSIRRPARTGTVSQRSYTSNYDSIPKLKSKSTYLGHLCVRHVVQYCGPYLLDLLKPPASKALGRMSLMVIREGIINGQADCRFNLVKLGCFAQIIDNIRGAEDEPEIQGLGLAVIRSLVSKDESLKQLFFAHGGMSLIMALHEYQEGLVKDEAAFTLTAFSKASTTTRSRAPGLSKKRQRKSADNDIWDHVTQKWQGQDKVTKLLKKFNVKY